METLLRDLRYAVRVLWKRPALTAAAVLCMALGIGATAVVFTVVNAVLLKPMPYPDAERVVVVWNRFLAREIDEGYSSGKEFEDHRDHDRSFEHLAGLIPWYFNLTGSGEPERLMGGRVSASLFSILGADPVVGRIYSKEEQDRGERLAVLSHGLWQRRFAGDRGVLGRTVVLDDLPYTVIGVLPEEARFPLLKADVWVPLVVNPRIPRHLRGVLVVGRIRADVGLSQAQSEMDAVAARFQEQYPDLYPEDSGWGIHLVPIKEQVVGEVRPQLLIVFGLVALVLLIACANVANLLLAQATTREKEIAIRTALGASHGGTVRQLLTESVLLALAGGAVGLLLALWGARSLVRLDLGNLPRLAEVGLDGRVLGFVFLVSLATGVLFGLAPALQSFRTDLQETLKEGGKTSAVGGRHPFLKALVVGEVALALTVLIGTGLMLRSFQRAVETDPGFRTEGLLTFELALSGAYSKAEDRVELSRRVLENLQQIPGVDAVGMASRLPMGVNVLSITVEAEGRVTGPGEHTPEVALNISSPGYFQTLGVPLVTGRDFDLHDHAQAPRVAILDDALAHRLWPGESPLDKRVRLLGSRIEDVWYKVVGVVRSIRNRGTAAAAVEEVYLPYSQYPGFVLSFAVLTTGEPMSLAPAVREAVWAVDPNQPLDALQPMAQRLQDSIALPRFTAFVLALFGAVALTLAALGVYGVMAYSVAQRTREVGIRMALGARRGDVLGLMVRQGGLLVGAGVILGLGLALGLVFLLSRFLADLFYGVSATDLTTFVAVPVILAALALVASWVPARRATRVDPLEALHYE